MPLVHPHRPAFLSQPHTRGAGIRFAAPGLKVTPEDRLVDDPVNLALRRSAYSSEVSRRLQSILLGLALFVGVGIGAAIAATRSSGTPASGPSSATAETADPQLDPGARLNAVAPDFTLTDQFGKRISLRSLRGKVVVLSFNDPKCTTICPLTTTALLHAKALLGPAASRVELIGVGANPEATQVKWVRAYSKVHGMLHKWHFLTGSLGELKRVWRSYSIDAAIVNGAIDHTPATYVIGPTGRESRLYQTAMAYSSVNQLGSELAQSIAALLPGHPRLHGTQSLAAPTLYGPREPVALPRAGGGSIRLGLRLRDHTSSSSSTAGRPRSPT